MLQTVEKLSQPKDSEGKIIGKKTVRVVFPIKSNKFQNLFKSFEICISLSKRSKRTFLTSWKGLLQNASCHCEPVRRLVWQSVFSHVCVRIPTPVCAPARNDPILQQALAFVLLVTYILRKYGKRLQEMSKLFKNLNMGKYLG